jgi:hypothetical protein
LARVILTLLGGYLIILLFLVVYEWVAEEFPRRPAPSRPAERIQHPAHHPAALRALAAFAELPEREKTAVKADLQSGLISLPAWLERLRHSGFEIICLGEVHEESTRTFLADEFFARLKTDVLLLETTPEQLAGFLRRLEAGRDYYPLLEADIMNVLRATRLRNPGVRIRGIEETEKQQNQKHGASNPRDEAIARNFWNAFQPGKRHTILFGAFHCANEANWLFGNLCRRASPALKARMLNVRVLGAHQNGPLEAFVHFLDAAGIRKRQFVIPDTRSLPPPIYEMFPLFNRQTLEKYRALVVFRQ